jgi:hypothetical protein
MSVSDVSVAPTEDTQSDDKPINDGDDLNTPPAEKSAQKEEVETASDECPGGGTMGVDLEKLEACGKCKVWDDCSAMADNLKKADNGKKEPEAPPEKKKIMRRRRRLTK